MSKINILDKEIFNLIAAGEVVEKPASVVKELVENSIDAGATIISIDVKNGGKYIRVSDNGCGIEKEDLHKAFLPHATSKIASKDDLACIGTLGFRGEALSSIAAVSKVTMLSKTKTSDGNKIVIEGGEIISIEPAGCTEGTTIIVDELFYNVPARAKFLRKDKLEDSDITNYVTRLILANPNISIKFTINDKLQYQTSGTNLFDAIFAIYGKNFVDNMSEFEYKDDTYKITGYVGNPTFGRPNKTYQTLMVNGRYVINSQISAAIYKSYENFLMKGNFPFYVLNIEVSLDKVDVNVHPNKLDIKFDDSNQIFGIMYSAVSMRLYDIHAINTVAYSNLGKKNIACEDVELDYSNVPFKTYEEKVKEEQVFEEEPIKQIDLENDKMFKENFENISSLLSKKSTEGFSVESSDLAYSLAEQLTMKQKEVMPKLESKTELSLNLNDFEIKGTLFNTYIFVEQGETLLIIDQHAAHERLLFDKFKQQFDEQTITIQPLLIPYILEVNQIEKTFIETNMDQLEQLGFELESFGDTTYKVNCVPVTLRNINLQTFFNEVLAQTVYSKIIIKKSDLMWDYIAKTACKSAVKANDILSETEIKVLLTNLSAKKDQVLLCPHGRPIVLKVTKTEVEKWFKRLV